jgi:prepilin-type N-terminal cleavage/methylation domain-containing protein/prepilin-type processing-associated H-X9-DG protein
MLLRYTAYPRRAAAFTLIELLVVIAIIAILAAILFPVFAQARAKARQAACLSNTKQIGTALMMYAQDYDEVMPGYRFGESSTPQMNPYWNNPNVGAQSDRNIFINQLLFPYTKNDDIWKCSSNPKAWVNVDDKNSLPAQNPDFKSYGGQNSFGANNYVFPSKRGFALAALPAPADTVGFVDTQYYNVLPKGPGAAPCVLRGDPSGTAFVTTSFYPQYWKNIGNSYVCFQDCPVPTEAQAVEAGKNRHSGMINVIWLDGHSKAMNYEKLVKDEGLKVDSTTSLWDPFKQGCN